MVNKFKTWLADSKPVMPVIVIDDLDHVEPLAKALVAGGVTLLEVTLRTPHALEAIAIIKETVPEAIVGAGTVRSEQDLASVIEAGAQFAVTPGLTANLIQAYKQQTEWGGVLIPGVATASEVMNAYEAGFRIMKAFPAHAIGGLEVLKAWQGPQIWWWIFKETFTEEKGRLVEKGG